MSNNDAMYLFEVVSQIYPEYKAQWSILYTWSGSGQTKMQTLKTWGWGHKISSTSQCILLYTFYPLLYKYLQRLGSLFEEMLYILLSSL